MRRNEKKIMSTLQNILFTLMVAVIMFLVLGLLMMPREDFTSSGEAELFQGEWKRVSADGIIEEIEVPSTCEAGRGEVVRVETVLPQEQKETWFCARASQQDMRVYIGDELRTEYTTKETRLFGINSASAYVFFHVTEADAGKTLAIETVSDSIYSGAINEIYVGEKYDIWNRFLKQYGLAVLVSLFMLTLSVITIVYSAVLRSWYKVDMEIAYLGWGLLLAALWLFCNSRIRQFFIPNSSIAAAVGFMVVMLLPYPYLSYINKVQKCRYQKIYIVMAFCALVNFVVSLVIQLCNVKDFFNIMMTSHAVIILLVIAYVVTILLDVKNGKIEEYKEVGFGFVGLILSALWEIYLVYQPTSSYSGIGLCLGLTFLLIAAAWKTGRDMLAIENKKQMAIYAGESKAKFLANMSHEIRTPINTVIGMNEMILRENKDETIEQYAKDIQNSSQLLLGLINDILDFSKIEAGKLDIIPTDYQVSKMLTGVIHGLRFKADSKEVEIRMEVADDIPSVLRGDEIRIRQILNNLLANAVKYTKKGTITLAVKGEYSSGGFELVMAVTDTGIGIKEEDIPHLFDSFQRLEEKKNRHIEGTGLGLNITKQLTDLMGGVIDVTSVYGKGSCFTVRIPQQVVNGAAMRKLEDAHLSDNKEKMQQPLLYAPDVRILAVDDTKMNLSVVKSLLKRTGIQIDTAPGGAECLKLCEKNKYDLILMDHMMPEPDGIETLHLLRANEGGLNQKTKVIVLTANAISGVREMYLAEGFTDYLAKPLVGEDLEAMLKNHLPKEKLQKSPQQIAHEEKKAEEKKSKELSDAVAKTIATQFSVNQTQNPLLVINKDAAMRYSAGDEELYKEVVQEYCNQEKEYSVKLKQYYDEQRWKDFQIVAHAIKGASLLVGANNFSEKAKSMEFAVKEDNIAKVQEEGEEFIATYRELVKLLEESEQF